MNAITGAVVLSALAATAFAQVPAGPEFQVSSVVPNYGQLDARVAMRANGDFAVVWEDIRGVVGQRFDASGTRRGSEFQINASTSGSQRTPAVVVGRDGEFVVVWESYPDGSQSGIRGRRYAVDGSAIGGEFLVNTVTTEQQRDPEIARGPDGRSIVTWQSSGVDGDLEGIAARRLDPAGNPIGAEFVVNTYTTGHQWLGGVAVETNGNFVIVWWDGNNRDGSGYAIIGQRFDGSGDRLGGEFVVNSYTTGSQGNPSVSASAQGGFVVAFGSPDGDMYGMFARRFDASGNPAGGDFRVNGSTIGHQYGFGGQIASDATGNFVVVWHASFPPDPDQDVFAQRFTASGARRGAEFRVNTYATGRQFTPTIASDAVGNFVVAWSSFGQSGATYGAFAQRFGGLQPTALAVDAVASGGSNGNGVFEEGESVFVSPSWRNVNGAAQTFSGALGDMTGPAGATYAITDPTGGYGTVADGATALCVDCYAVSVSDPPTRPAVHWDASAVESIVPDTQGQQKQWILHVGDSFTDVPAINPFYRFVETLLHHGVTGGCSTTEYCPASSTTREQMAVFVLVAKEGAGYTPPPCGSTPMFIDVPASHPFCRWIEELARRAVVSGCGGGNYCPTNPVTREQMAVFVLRTLDPTLAPPACTTPLYNDVPPASGFCPWIEELTRRAVVTGCGGGNYCPFAAVTREQMGVFLSVTFGLILYGP